MHSTIKQILDFNKKAFDDSFNAIVAVQEHAEKMARIFWEKSSFFPGEGKKVVGDWINAYKNGLNEYRANVDSRFKFVESYLLSAADQLEASFNTNVKPAGPDASVDVKKAAVRKPAAKKAKIGSKKTNKQK